MPESMPPSRYMPQASSFEGTAARQIAASEQTPVKVLLVDDHTIVREGLVSLLEKFKDLTVVGHCNDYRTGIQMIETLAPDVIITDLAMEGASPFELARRAKTLLPHVKVIFLTSAVTDSNLERGLDAGAAGFISKTEPVSGIVTAIRQVHTGKKYFSDDVKKRLVARQSYDPNQNSYTPRRALLSPREIEVLCCVAKGMKAKNIGKTLHITAKTVERHKSNIMAKLGLHSQVDLAIYAIREGYVTP